MGMAAHKVGYKRGKKRWSALPITYHNKFHTTNSLDKTSVRNHRDRPMDCRHSCRLLCKPPILTNSARTALAAMSFRYQDQGCSMSQIRARIGEESYHSRLSPSCRLLFQSQCRQGQLAPQGEAQKHPRTAPWLPPMSAAVDLHYSMGAVLSSAHNAIFR